MGLASRKFSGSVIKVGKNSTIPAKKKSITNSPMTSLYVKYGWKEILEIWLRLPKGLEDPFTCKVARCTTTAKAIASGNKKWKL